MPSIFRYIEDDYNHAFKDGVLLPNESISVMIDYNENMSEADILDNLKQKLEGNMFYFLEKDKLYTSEFLKFNLLAFDIDDCQTFLKILKMRKLKAFL